MSAEGFGLRRLDAALSFRAQDVLSRERVRNRWICGRTLAVIRTSQCHSMGKRRRAAAVQRLSPRSCAAQLRTACCLPPFLPSSFPAFLLPSAVTHAMSTTVEPIEKGRLWPQILAHPHQCGSEHPATDRASSSATPSIAPTMPATPTSRASSRAPESACQPSFMHDPVEGVMVMEDVGGDDLFSFRNAPWPERRRLYEHHARSNRTPPHPKAHLTERLPHRSSRHSTKRSIHGSRTTSSSTASAGISK